MFTNFKELEAYVLGRAEIVNQFYYKPISAGNQSPFVLGLILCTPV